MVDIDCLYYTDGACSCNPGNGAWGFIKVLPDTVIIKSSMVECTTNNRMELMAIIEAVRHSCGRNYKTIKIVSDSMYCINSYNNWRKIWWMAKSKDEETKNRDLWNELFTLVRDSGITIKFEWVKGHNGNKYNSMIDKVVQAMSKG